MDNEYKSNLWKVYALQFFLNFHLFTAVLIPFFTQWGHLTFSQIMILQSWFLLCAMICDVPTGTFADHFGRKRSMIIATVLELIGILIYVNSTGFLMFMFGETFWAVGMSFLTGADDALIYDTLKNLKIEHESKKVYQQMYVFTMLGLFIATPLGSFVASWYGIRMPMFLTAGAFCIAMAISFTLKEPKIESTEKKPSFFTTIKEGWQFFRSSKVIQILALDMMVVSSLAYFMIWLYQPLLQSIGVDIFYFGWVHAALVLLQILIMLFYNKFEEIIGSKKLVMFMMAIVTALSILVAGLSKNVYIVITSIVLSTAFGFTRKPIFSNYSNKFIPSDKRATVLSVVSMLGRVVLVVLNPIVGWMMEWSLQNTLIILGVVGLVFTLFSGIEEHHLID